MCATEFSAKYHITCPVSDVDLSFLYWCASGMALPGLFASTYLTTECWLLCIFSECVSVEYNHHKIFNFDATESRQWIVSFKNLTGMYGALQRCLSNFGVSDTIIITSNLAASRLHEIWMWDVLPLGSLQSWWCRRWRLQGALIAD